MYIKDDTILLWKIIFPRDYKFTVQFSKRRYVRKLEPHKKMCDLCVYKVSKIQYLYHYHNCCCKFYIEQRLRQRQSCQIVFQRMFAYIPQPHTRSTIYTQCVYVYRISRNCSLALCLSCALFPPILPPLLSDRKSAMRLFPSVYSHPVCVPCLIPLWWVCVTGTILITVTRPTYVAGW